MANSQKEQGARQTLWNLLKTKYKGKQREAAISRVKTLLKEYDGSYRGVYDLVLEKWYCDDEPVPEERPLAEYEYCPYNSYMTMKELL